MKVTSRPAILVVVPLMVVMSYCRFVPDSPSSSTKLASQSDTLVPSSRSAQVSVSLPPACILTGTILKQTFLLELIVMWQLPFLSRLSGRRPRLLPARSVSIQLDKYPYVQSSLLADRGGEVGCGVSICIHLCQQCFAIWDEPKQLSHILASLTIFFRSSRFIFLKELHAAR